MYDLIRVGRSHRLSSYDASYLDLAMRKGLPLATLDKNLHKAAKSVNVPLLKE
ncbi:MAG: type II toxin-antitoxin system VapC family toxin [Candidatus Aminicenantes bacterium]|nr:type II toxin-antitoxin system VapC family toxin [Candidatus Aminicenantes bacterium]